MLHDTETFMRGDLDNVTVFGGRILLDRVQGVYVPYGCYTSPPLALPPFEALRVSWNADTPQGSAVEMQARVMVDGNWSAWCSFGRWSPYLPREGAPETARGPLHLCGDQLTLESKVASQAQLRIYLYTRQDTVTPAVRLLAASVQPLDVIPAGGRPVNARLHLIPYVTSRRAPSLRAQMDLAICLASMTNRWGADLLPEELAQALRDYRGNVNLSFAAAACACWGFPAWVGWADLAQLRSELRAGYGAVAMLESTPAQVAAGLPPTRCVALRGFAGSEALLIDPQAGDADFDAETSMPLDDFLVAWNNLALFMRPRTAAMPGQPARTAVSVRALPGAGPGLYGLYTGSTLCPLPADLADQGGVLAWSAPDARPHATTAHLLFHFVQPEQGGIRLEPEQTPCRCSVYAIQPSGAMLVGDVTL